MGNYLLLGAGLTNFCGEISEILQLVGWALTIFKIAIPLIIIAVGLIDLGKAAVSSKPEEVRKSATSLIWRLVGGIVIFFIPTIVMLVFGLVSGWSGPDGIENQVNFDVCRACVERPWNATDCHK